MESHPAHSALCQQSIRMLHEVLDGEPLAAVSARMGVSRSAVERRVKALAMHLTQAVGVDGLRQDGPSCVKRLRLRREAILAALDQFDPDQAASRRGARVISAEDVDLGAMRVRSRSNRPHHDLALYHLLFATGLRPLEVARLRVGDYLQEDGGVRRESCVRAEVAINGRPRPLFFSHRRLDDALSVYLQERMGTGHGVGRAGAWRGLDPDGALFLGADGERYAITPNGVAGQQRQVCRTLLEVYRRIFRQADIQGLCAQSGRLTLMFRMYERGADEDQVGIVMGIADRSAVREQLPRPRPRLSDVMDQQA